MQDTISYSYIIEHADGGLIVTDPFTESISNVDLGAHNT